GGGAPGGEGAGPPGRWQPARQREQPCNADGAASRKERDVGLATRECRRPQPPLCRTLRDVSGAGAVPRLVAGVVDRRRGESIDDAILPAPRERPELHHLAPPPPSYLD